MEADEVKQAQRALYEAGEYFALSAVLAPAAEVLVDESGVVESSRVLDVGAGDGNVALAAASRGASVVATDLSPIQVERGRARTAAEGFDVEWRVADAEELPFEDSAFSHVLSAFGVVAAPRPDVAARELVRVCRPGGTVALTAWPPDSFMGQLRSAADAALPDDVDLADPELEWGVEPIARRRLERFAAVRCDRRSLEIDPAQRGAAGTRDCAAAYLSSLADEDALATLAGARARLGERFGTGDGRVRADYLLLVADVHR